MKEDCFYFMTSSCARGDNCTYRHSAEAKVSEIVCDNWKRGLECYEGCPYKHSEYQVKEKSVAECYWEKHGGCKKPSCPYRHTLPPTSTESTPCLLDIQKLNFELEKLEINHCHSDGSVRIKSINELIKDLQEIEEVFHL